MFAACLTEKGEDELRRAKLNNLKVKEIDTDCIP